MLSNSNWKLVDVSAIYECSTLIQVKQPYSVAQLNGLIFHFTSIYKIGAERDNKNKI